MAQVTTLSQRDPRWSNSPLGDSTIGAEGCLITSLASLLGLTPPEVVNRLNAVGGLLNGKSVIWAKLSEAFPGMTQKRVWSWDEQLATSQLPTLLEVDFDATPRTDNKHWVVLINKDTIMDPWTGSIEPSSKYPSKTGFCLVVIPDSIDHGIYYKGLDLTNEESMKVAIDAWEKVKDGLLVDKGQFELQANAASQCQSQLKSALEQATSFQEQSASLQQELKEVKSKYENEQKLVLSLKGEIEEIHKQDKDFGQEALDAQHKYNEIKEATEHIAQIMDVQYNPSDDKSLVEAILQEINNREQMALPQNQNTQLQSIIKKLETYNINQYLINRGLPAIDLSKFDEQLDTKVNLFLTDLVNELIEKKSPQDDSTAPKETPATNAITTPRVSKLYSLLLKLLSPILIKTV